MKTLIIKDLAITCELDRGAMLRVRGGYKMQQSHSLYPSSSYSPTFSSSVDVRQNLEQMQDVVNATANGSAFIDGVTVHNNTDQFGQNNVLVHH